MADLVDKATAWDAVAEKNARIAELERENTQLKEERARIHAVLSPHGRKHNDLDKDVAEALAIMEGRE